MNKTTQEFITIVKYDYTKENILNFISKNYIITSNSIDCKLDQKDFDNILFNVTKDIFLDFIKTCDAPSDIFNRFITLLIKNAGENNCYLNSMIYTLKSVEMQDNNGKFINGFKPMITEKEIEKIKVISSVEIEGNGRYSILINSKFINMMKTIYRNNSKINEKHLKKFQYDLYYKLISNDVMIINFNDDITHTLKKDYIFKNALNAFVGIDDNNFSVIHILYDKEKLKIDDNLKVYLPDGVKFAINTITKKYKDFLKNMLRSN